MRDITDRKRMEETLEESEKQYRMLFDKSMDGIILTDPRGIGIILSANPAACKMLGWAEEELILKGLDVIFDVKNPAISTLLDEHIPSGSAKSQINYRRKDGTTLNGEISSTFFIDRNGEPRAVSIIRDITERKRVEKALHEAYEKLQAQSEELQVSNEELKAQSEELHEAYETLWKNEQRLDGILNSIQDGFFELDHEWRYTYINQRAAKNAGFEPEDHIGRCIWEMFPFAVGTQFETVYREVMETRKPAHFEAKSPSLEMMFDISVYPSPVGISIFWRDITERKRAEETLSKAYENLQVQAKELQAQSEEIQMQNEELQSHSEELRKAYKTLYESEEKYRNIVETTNEGVWISDATGRTTYANEKMADLLGYSQGELIGKYGWEFADEEYSAISKANMEKRWQGIDEIHEYKFMRKDGSPLWVLVNSQSLTDKHGKFTGVLAMFTDITERKQAEERLAYQANLLANISDVVYSTDDQLRLVSWNQAAEKVYGLKKEEVLGKNVIEVTGSMVNPEMRSKLIVELHEKGSVYH